MKALTIISAIACILAAGSPVVSAADVPAAFKLVRIESPAEPNAIPIYPGRAPGSEDARQVERWARLPDGNVIVRNVTRPTITPFLPSRSKATGAAVIILPGGGHNALWMEGEGLAPARWLAAHGVAAFVLKYRVNATPDDESRFRNSADMIFVHDTTDGRAHGLLDAQQALRMVRGNAARWKIDPARIGMMGYSAGAITTLDTVLANDPAARPDFIGYFYAFMTAVTPPKEAGPMFIGVALDDFPFGHQGFGLVESWQKIRRPVELHAYERGGHGFGMGRPGTTTTMVMDEYLLWLKTRSLLDKPKPK